MASADARDPQGRSLASVVADLVDMKRAARGPRPMTVKLGPAFAAVLPRPYFTTLPDWLTVEQRVRLMPNVVEVLIVQVYRDYQVEVE